MRIATWNVNSVRARLERLLAWLERADVDVVCLQELKGETDVFPYDAIEAAGYHAAVYGQKTYNGVAILSRTAPTHIQRGWPEAPPAGVDEEQARLIAATVDGVRTVTAYVPNGQSVGSDAWAYKLAWLRQLRSYLEQTADPATPLVLCGDFNVAPSDDADVAKPEKWQGSVLTHAEAREALTTVTSWGLTDAIRLHHDGPGPYSWWDYRHLAFPKGNGLRIDHIFATEPLATRCTDATVDRDERKGPKPSDHAPVVAVFDV